MSPLAPPDPAATLAAKVAARESLAVILPAHNEAATIGPLVETLRRHLVVATPFIDDLLVIDSGSTDATADAARAAGARVVAAHSIRPDVPVTQGKGDTLWRAIQATSSTIVCFIDADLDAFDPATVTALVAPLLTNSSCQLTKPACTRPLTHMAGSAGSPGALHPKDPGGGRITEILARPLLSWLYPPLARLSQPLAGEYAARRDLLTLLTFPTGYGVEISLLIQIARLHGPHTITEVPCSPRRHRVRPTSALTPAASSILHATLRQATLDGLLGPIPAAPPEAELPAAGPAGHGSLPIPVP